MVKFISAAFLCTSVAITLVTPGYGFSLPGVSPVTYHASEEVPLLVNHLSPSLNFDHSQSSFSSHEDALYSFDFYDERLHFCRPKTVERQPESLGSILFGDRIYNSPFRIKMLENVQCAKLCRTTIPAKDAKFINRLIHDGFEHNWLVDGLPAARIAHDPRTKSDFYRAGFELGSIEIIAKGIENLDQEEEEPAGEDYKSIEEQEEEYEAEVEHEIEEMEEEIELEDQSGTESEEDIENHEKREPKNVVSNLVGKREIPYLYNHFDIEIEYHHLGSDNYRVVGVIVHPKSIKSNFLGRCVTSGSPISLNEDRDNKVDYSYSVKFIASETRWATRWDKYLHVYDPKIQTFSLINFSGIVLLLSAVVAHSISRALKQDFSRYNDFNLSNEFQEEYGWKLLHGDVFRPVTNVMLLSILVGSGFQLFWMIISSIILAAVGLTSPSARGSLPTMMLVLYALFGGVGSYMSMGVYKFMKGQYWKANMVLTPLLVPGFILSMIIGLNFFLIFAKSSGAIPASALMFTIFLWFVVSIPVSFIGSLLAIRRCHWDEHPTKTNELARHMPMLPWYLRTYAATMITNMFSFGSISVELYFIYSSLWFNKIFYMFGFLLVSFILLVITTTLTSVFVTYKALCHENWTWQWRAFTISGVGCGVYMFLFSILYTRFQFQGFTTIVLYTGYSMLISVLTAIVTGAIGYMASMIFVRKIYSTIKFE